MNDESWAVTIGDAADVVVDCHGSTIIASWRADRRAVWVGGCLCGYTHGCTLTGTHAVSMLLCGVCEMLQGAKLCAMPAHSKLMPANFARRPNAIPRIE